MKIHSTEYELVEFENMASWYRGILLLSNELKDLNSISDNEQISIDSCEGKFSILPEDPKSNIKINYPAYSNFLDNINEIHSTWKYDRRGFQCWPSKQTIKGYVLDVSDSSTGVTAEYTLSENGILSVKTDSNLKLYEKDKNGISTIRFIFMMLNELAKAGNQLNRDTIEYISKQ